MATEVMDKEGLKDALKMFKSKGDERWAKIDEVETLLDDAISEGGVLTEDDVGELSDDELTDIIDALSEDEEGETP